MQNKIIETINKMSKEYPNDADFGGGVRSYLYLLQKEKYLQSRIDWLEKALYEIIDYPNYDTVSREIRHIAKSYLDGEPTTADEFNQ